MSKKKSLAFAMLLCCVSMNMQAQSDDFGLWTGLEVKKSIVKGLDLSAEGEYRLRNDWKDTERWSVGTSLSYRMLPFLKAAVGYTYLKVNRPETTTAKGNIIPEYWSPRHRFNASLTGNVKAGRFEFSLRERYQVTHREALSVPKISGKNGSAKDNEEISSKTKTVLRSRLQAEYNIRKCPLAPYASVEIYNSMDRDGKLDKTRYTAGTAIKLNKHNAIDVYYLYQNKQDDDEPSGHVLGVGYTIKF